MISSSVAGTIAVQRFHFNFQGFNLNIRILSAVDMASCWSMSTSPSLSSLYSANYGTEHEILTLFIFSSRLNTAAFAY